MTPFFKTPVGVVLFTQARVLWASFLLTFVIEMAAITPILYMLNTYDRVLSSRSFVTLLSLTAVLVLIYLFSSLLEWLWAQILIRLALRLDWELAPDVFDAAYRSQLRRHPVPHAGVRRQPVHEDERDAALTETLGKNTEFDSRGHGDMQLFDGHSVPDPEAAMVSHNSMMDRTSASERGHAVVPRTASTKASTISA